MYNSNEYRLAGNFHRVLIFVIRMTDLRVTKLCTPRKFATVGKGRQAKSRHKCAHNRDRVHGSISGISVLLTVSSTNECRESIRFCRFGDGQG